MTTYRVRCENVGYGYYRYREDAETAARALAVERGKQTEVQFCFTENETHPTATVYNGHGAQIWRKDATPHRTYTDITRLLP